MFSQSSQFAVACLRPVRLTGSSVIVVVGQCFSLRQENPSITLHTGEIEDIRQSRNGDSDAYRRLIERHQTAVGKLLWRFTRDRTEHEELVQQTFVEVYLSLSGFRAEAPFAHWLSRIATRVGYRYWSQIRKSKAVAMPDEAWERLSRLDNDAVDTQQAAELVHRLLAQLPPRDRLVLTLRYLEQCDIAQTAYRLGWTQTRVKVQTHRAIARLKKLTAHTNIELEL